jgi:hypothetical protein
MTYPSNNHMTLLSHMSEVPMEGLNWGPKTHREQLFGNKSGLICLEGALVILFALIGCKGS